MYPQPPAVAPSGGLIDDAAAALEASVTRIATAAASTALQQALPAIRETVATPQFAYNVGAGAVNVALAPQNRPAMAELARDAGKSAAEGYGPFALALALAAGIGVGAFLARR
jgi:hypothetical protein